MPPSPALDVSSSLQQVLDVLACPVCLHPLQPTPAEVLCTGCHRSYPVLDGIPILLADRATLPQAHP